MPYAASTITWPNSRKSKTIFWGTIEQATQEDPSTPYALALAIKMIEQDRQKGKSSSSRGSIDFKKESLKYFKTQFHEKIAADRISFSDVATKTGDLATIGFEAYLIKEGLKKEPKSAALAGWTLLRSGGLQKAVESLQFYQNALYDHVGGNNQTRSLVAQLEPLPLLEAGRAGMAVMARKYAMEDDGYLLLLSAALGEKHSEFLRVKSQFQESSSVQQSRPRQASSSTTKEKQIKQEPKLESIYQPYRNSGGSDQLSEEQQVSEEQQGKQESTPESIYQPYRNSGGSDQLSEQISAEKSEIFKEELNTISHIVKEKRTLDLEEREATIWIATTVGGWINRKVGDSVGMGLSVSFKLSDEIKKFNDIVSGTGVTLGSKILAGANLLQSVMGGIQVLNSLMAGSSFESRTAEDLKMMKAMLSDVAEQLKRATEHIDRRLDQLNGKIDGIFKIGLESALREIEILQDGKRYHGESMEKSNQIHHDLLRNQAETMDAIGSNHREILDRLESHNYQMLLDEVSFLLNRKNMLSSPVDEETLSRTFHNVFSYANQSNQSSHESIFHQSTPSLSDIENTIEDQMKKSFRGNTKLETYPDTFFDLLNQYAHVRKLKAVSHSEDFSMPNPLGNPKRWVSLANSFVDLLQQYPIEVNQINPGNFFRHSQGEVTGQLPDIIKKGKKYLSYLKKFKEDHSLDPPQILFNELIKDYVSQVKDIRKKLIHLKNDIIQTKLNGFDPWGSWEQERADSAKLQVFLETKVLLDPKFSEQKRKITHLYRENPFRVDEAYGKISPDLLSLLMANQEDWIDRRFPSQEKLQKDSRVLGALFLRAIVDPAEFEKEYHRLESEISSRALANDISEYFSAFKKNLVKAGLVRKYEGLSHDLSIPSAPELDHEHQLALLEGMAITIAGFGGNQSPKFYYPLEFMTPLKKTSIVWQFKRGDSLFDTSSEPFDTIQFKVSYKKGCVLEEGTFILDDIGRARSIIQNRVQALRTREIECVSNVEILGSQFGPLLDTSMVPGVDLDNQRKFSALPLTVVGGRCGRSQYKPISSSGSEQGPFYLKEEQADPKIYMEFLDEFHKNAKNNLATKESDEKWRKEIGERELFSLINEKKIEVLKSLRNKIQIDLRNEFENLTLRQRLIHAYIRLSMPASAKSDNFIDSLLSSSTPLMSGKDFEMSLSDPNSNYLERILFESDMKRDPEMPIFTIEKLKKKLAEVPGTEVNALIHGTIDRLKSYLKVFQIQFGLGKTSATAALKKGH